MYWRREREEEKLEGTEETREKMKKGKRKKINIGSHGKQHGGCKARRMNPALSQQRTSLDIGQTNPIGQRPGSNSLFRNLQLIF